MATRRYSAFRLRCWIVGDQQRIEIEHIQSGEKVRCTSALAAVDWLYAHAAGTAPAPEVPTLARGEVDDQQQQP